MFSRIYAISKKEVKQILRDVRMLIIIFFFPVFLLGVFGYVVNFDVENIKLAVLNYDKSSTSRQFISNLTNSVYFDYSADLNDDDEIKHYLDKKLAQVVLVIPADFTEKLNNTKTEAKVQFLIDGVDGNTATTIYNYVNIATRSFGLKFQQEFLSLRGLKINLPIEVEPVFWFNRNLESTKFLLPGLIAMILVIVAVISVSLSLVREKEKGTIEQLNVSSLTNLELLVGKSIPYIFISLINAALVLIAGYLLFGIEVKGSLLLLFISTLIFTIAAVNIGIFVSVISDSQQVAFSISTFVSLLPSVILSGFIFPIESMPFIVQIFTNITPAKFFMTILRSIILKGVGIEAFYMELIYLIIFAMVFIILSIIMAKRKEKKA